MSAGTSRVPVLLVRHGESEWNVVNRFQGQADTALTDVGRDQAKQAGTALAALLGDRPVTVVASDLVRARDTALAIADAVGAGPVATDPALREVSAGAWEGLLHPEIEAGWPQLYARWRAREDVPFGEDERPSEAGRRVAAAVVRYHREATAAGHALVVVAHGACLRAAVSRGVGWAEGYRRLAAMGNAHRAEVLLGDAGAGPTDGGGEAGATEADWRLVRYNVPPG